MYDDILGEEEEREKIKTITLKWNKSTSALGYYLYKGIINLKTKKVRFEKIDVGNRTTIEINVEPNKDYEFKVTAYNNKGESDFSKTIKCV